VKVVGNAVCEQNTVASRGKAYYAGVNVGSFDTTIFKTEDETLTMKIKAQYLGKTVNKLIQCKE
jgi:ribosomal protein L27